MATDTELTSMHLAYEAADCSGQAAQRLYTQYYPMRQTLCHTFFTLLQQRLSDSGVFGEETQQHEQTVGMAANEEVML